MNYKHSGVNHPTTTAYCFFQQLCCYIEYIHIGTTTDQKNDAAAAGEMIAAVAGATSHP